MLENAEKETNKNIRIVVYGAKSIALGVCQAIRELYPECSLCCFLVSSLQNNPSILAGLPVRELKKFSQGLTQKEKDEIHVLIGTPEDLHLEIVAALEQHGLYHYTCMDSRREAKLMEQYFVRKQIFSSVHALKPGKEAAHLQVFMAKFHKDKPLKNEHKIPDWLCSLQVGAGLTEKRVAEFRDNIGDNISCKNVNYCELTALYWIWKNRLMNFLPEDKKNELGAEYFGLFHYRRILDIADEDLLRFKENDIDVILPYPTIHEPNIKEHHTRYISEEDWQAMLRALKELQPKYMEFFETVFTQPYFYNYNMIIAKKEVLAEYCAWLFPILERTEELSVPKGAGRSDRYIGYLGENLMTLYFLHNRKRLNIYHTGRIMLT
ncbi:MAG: DUF4422 domain-containing protein [Clostridiales bacterium]|nr:DUF4422 domain-containing protein [Clostridiales bacterium]